MHVVYILKSVEHWRFYVGMTSDLKRRLREHNGGKTKSTSGYRPWELFFYETYQSRQDARAREKYLKSGSGKELIKSMWLDKEF